MSEVLCNDLKAGARLLKRLQKQIKRWRKEERQLLEQLLLDRDSRLQREAEERQRRQWLSRHTKITRWTDYTPFGDVDHTDYDFEYCQDPSCDCNQPGFKKPNV